MCISKVIYIFINHIHGDTRIIFHKYHILDQVDFTTSSVSYIFSRVFFPSISNPCANHARPQFLTCGALINLPKIGIKFVNKLSRSKMILDVTELQASIQPSLQRMGQKENVMMNLRKTIIIKQLRYKLFSISKFIFMNILINNLKLFHLKRKLIYIR